MQFWGITDCGSVRKENQDAYQICLLDECTVVGIVCDGMGGARAGNVASQLAVETFVEELRLAKDEAEKHGWETLLKYAAEQANGIIYQRSCEDEGCRGMGTTMVAALVNHERILVLNVGDSRCYLVNGESIKQITHDHSLVGHLVERGELTPEEARCHPRKNLITRALGVDKSVRADIFELERISGGFLLLCSDGLSNLVTDPELLYEIIYGGEAADCCQRLLDISLSRGASDNVTAVLMQL